MNYYVGFYAWTLIFSFLVEKIVLLLDEFVSSVVMRSRLQSIIVFT